MNWIPVKDQAPPGGTRVLAFLQIGSCSFQIIVTAAAMQDPDDDDPYLAYYRYITHWMDLPDGPDA